jgi:hypothetical protein
MILLYIIGAWMAADAFTGLVHWIEDKHPGLIVWARIYLTNPVPAGTLGRGGLCK